MHMALQTFICRHSFADSGWESGHARVNSHSYMQHCLSSLQSGNQHRKPTMSAMHRRLPQNTLCAKCKLHAEQLKLATCKSMLADCNTANA